jgi:hypothetical protein
MYLLRSLSFILEDEGHTVDKGKKRYISDSTPNISYRFLKQRALVSSVK